MSFNRQLRELIIQGFSPEKLRDLCADQNVNYDDLGEERISSKARELVAYMERRGRTADLLALCAEYRPTNVTPGRRVPTAVMA